MLVYLINSLAVVLSPKIVPGADIEGVNTNPIVKSPVKEICPVVCKCYSLALTKVKAPAK